MGVSQIFTSVRLANMLGVLFDARSYPSDGAFDWHLDGFL
jgi:hypothetical protein